MSGHCDWCGVFHSGSCCHPGRVLYAASERRVAELENLAANREEYRTQVEFLQRENADLCMTLENAVTEIEAAYQRGLREAHQQSDSTRNVA